MIRLFYWSLVGLAALAIAGRASATPPLYTDGVNVQWLGGYPASTGSGAVDSGTLRMYCANCSGGGGGGGAVTGAAASFADGWDSTQGAQADAAWSGSGAGSRIAIAKYIAAKTEAVRALLAAPLAVTGTFWQATQPVSAAALPLPAGAATAAKQPALGTAGAASADVLSVQGVAAMTALKVDGSAVTQPVSGSVSIAGNVGLAASSNLIGALTGSTGATGALSMHKLIAAATTNATSVKSSAGRIYGGTVANVAASTRYLKLYNKASAPTVGTDTPVLTLPVPAGQTLSLSTMLAGPLGAYFSTGIAYAITGAAADADTTAVSAGDVIVGMLYL
ncbi:MAG: hypothetical protein ACR2F8_03030 [Caulobacteraceae bacterium]